MGGVVAIASALAIAGCQSGMINRLEGHNAQRVHTGIDNMSKTEKQAYLSKFNSTDRSRYSKYVSPKRCLTEKQKIYLEGKREFDEEISKEIHF